MGKFQRENFLIPSETTTDENFSRISMVCRKRTIGAGWENVERKFFQSFDEAFSSLRFPHFP